MLTLRRALALVIFVWGAVQAATPIGMICFWLHDGWPAGWALMRLILSPVLDHGGTGGMALSRMTPLLQSANWVQISMAFVAGALYLLSSLQLIGHRPDPAFSVFAVAVLLDVLTWLTFARSVIYDQTVPPVVQGWVFAVFWALMALSALVWFAVNLGRPPMEPNQGVGE